MSDRRLALIIANSAFDDPKLRRLKTPTLDAEALAEVLDDTAIGDFDVTLLLDQPESVVRREIARLYARRSKSDLLLFYYSGHGIRDDHGDLYLATKDTEIDLVSATALDTAYVRTEIDKSRSQRKVVVLDCCHSGAFAKAGLGDSVGTEDAFAGSGYGRVILTASNALELAWEGDEWLGEGRPSVFTHFLVEGLSTGAADLDGDGKIVLDELYNYVYEQVLTSGHAKQTPHKWAQKVQGQIVIAHSPLPVIKPIELPSDLQQAIRSPLAGLREGAVRELGHLLRGSDEALMLLAQEALTQLADDDSRRVSAAAIAALGATVEPASVRTPPVEVKKPKPALTPQREPLAKPAPGTFTITSPIHLELVRIPAGEFLMGSDPAKDKDASDSEQPQHRVHVPEFYIAKTPLTNTQYAAFVKATNYEAPRHWEKGNIPSGKGNHPVVYVSWQDAIAFCEWLSRETGQSFSLPTEAEWEKAARGIDGRKYPWGDQQPTPELCNFGNNEKDTTAVGKYSPQGDSPYGCADMAGNVWEWTRSLHKEYPYDSGDGREDVEASGSRVLRGGSFLSYRGLARCAARSGGDPQYRVRYGGFRVMVAAPFSPVHFSE